MQRGAEIQNHVFCCYTQPLRKYGKWKILYKILNNIKGNGLEHVEQISPKCLSWQAHFHKPTGTCDIGHPSLEEEEEAKRGNNVFKTEDKYTS
jgi:hypothetical protein